MTYDQVLEIKECEHGYVILSNRRILDREKMFETYVGFVSFLNDKNSKFISEVLLSKNIDCNSLSLAPMMNSKDIHTHLNVTVVCGTNLI